MAWTPTKLVMVGGFGSVAALTMAKVFGTLAGEIVYGPASSSFVYDGRWVQKIGKKNAEN